MYKSGYESSFEEYIGDCFWNAICFELSTEGLEEISEDEADEFIKEMEGDEYNLVDGCVSVED